MKWSCAISLIFALLSGKNAAESSIPTSVEGLTPSQIEKIMIEEIVDKPKKDEDKKEAFDFVKTVTPILATFKAEMLKEKNEQQKQLNDDVAAVKACITKMKNSMKLALLESSKKKQAKKLVAKCPTKKELSDCTKKIKKLKPKQKACKDIKKVDEKSHKTIKELLDKWQKEKVAKKDCVKGKGETTYLYAKRLVGHFEKLLDKFEKKKQELLGNDDEKAKIDKNCDLIQHYADEVVRYKCDKQKEQNKACTCDKAHKEKKVCSQMDGCYAATVANYKTNSVIIEKKNEAAKLEWRAVGRVECLVKVLGGKKAADAKQLENCVKVVQISTKPLDLVYPKVPEKPKCAMKGVTKEQRKECAQGAKQKKKPAAKKSPVKKR